MNNFKVNDCVKCIRSGSGLGSSCIGKIYTVTELGMYGRIPGVKIDPPEGNTKSGRYGGWIGENSFELINTSPGRDKRLLLKKK